MSIKLYKLKKKTTSYNTKDRVEFIELQNLYKNPYIVKNTKIAFKNDLSIEIYVGDLELIETIISTYINDPFSWNSDITIKLNKETIENNISDIKEDLDCFVKNLVQMIKEKDIVEIYYKNNEEGKSSFNTNKGYVPYLISKFRPDDYFLKKYLKSL